VKSHWGYSLPLLYDLDFQWKKNIFIEEKARNIPI